MWSYEQGQWFLLNLHEELNKQTKERYVYSNLNQIPNTAQQIYKKCPITASTQCFPLETFYWGISFHIYPPLCTLLAIISQKSLKQASWRTLLSPAGTVSCIVDLWSQKFDAFMSFMWDPIVLLRLSSELAMKMEERERLSLRSSMIKVSFFFLG